MINTAVSSSRSHSIVGALICCLAGIVTLGSCGNLLSRLAPENSPETIPAISGASTSASTGASTGAVRITLAGLNQSERTVMPYEQASIALYVLTAEKVGETLKLIEAAEPGLLELTELSPGDWVLTVEARDSSSRVLYSGSKIASVTAGAFVPVTIVMKASKSHGGTGHFTIVYSFPDPVITAQDASIVLTGYPDTGSNYPDAFTAVPGGDYGSLTVSSTEAGLAAGTYLLQLNVLVNDVSYQLDEQIVQIYNNLVSTTPNNAPIVCNTSSLKNSLTVYYVIENGTGTGERPSSPTNFDSALTSLNFNSLVSPSTPGTIVLMSDLTLSLASPGYKLVKNVAIRSLDPNNIQKITSATPEQLFLIGDETGPGRLALSDVIIQPDGVTVAQSGLITVHNGTLSLGPGSLLTGNTGTLGGAVYSQGPDSMVILEGGRIENCKAPKGGAIYAENGTIRLKAGYINGCQASQHGAAIYVCSTAYLAADADASSIIGVDNVTKGAGRMSIESLGSISLEPSAVSALINTCAPALSNEISQQGLVFAAPDVGMSVFEPQKVLNALEAAQYMSVYLTLGSMMSANPTHVSNPVTVNHVLHINGPGAILQGWEFDASGSQIETPLDSALTEGPLFTVNSGGSLAVNGLTLVGSGETYTSDHPIILVNDGWVSLSYTTLSNHTNTGNGGGIQQLGGSVELTGSLSLNRCSASRGGGIYVTGGNTIIRDYVSFAYCKATTEGGALWVGDGTVDIETAGTMQGFIFEADETKRYGGVIYQKGGTISCSAAIKPLNGFTNVDGAGVYITGGSFTMNGGTITGCQTTGGQGGAVFVAGTGAGSTGTFTINFGSIGSTALVYESEWNKAVNGAGIYVGSYGTAQLYGGSIFKNVASGSGGGVFIADSGTAIINGTTIGDSYSTDYGNSSGENGGGVYVQATNSDSYGTLSMTNGLIGFNTATGSGGGVYLEGGTCTLNGGQIRGNTATSANGGGVWMNAGASKPARIDFRQSAPGLCITENHAESGSGGGVWNETPTIDPFLRSGAVITTADLNTFISGNMAGISNDYNTAP